MNSKLPLVSIRIPAYNHENFILETLNSILENEYPNKEVVIINDGSTDNTGVLIEKWIDENKEKILVKYKSRENRGITFTINEMISMCSGKYICGIASDDYLLENGITERVQYLENNPQKMAVFGDSIIVDKDSKLLYNSAIFDYYKANKNNYLEEKSLQNEIILNWAVPGPVLMVNRDLYNKFEISYNEKLAVEDWDMYLKLISKNLLGFIDYPVSAYRLHNSNISLYKQNKILKDRFKTIIYNIKFFKFAEKIKLILVGFKLIFTYVIRILINLKKRINHGI